MNKLVSTYGLYFAWLVSVIAVGGSLFFSEIAGFIPCTLCWYQRIFMYPLAIILGIATFYNDKKVIGYALPFPIIGSVISIYHILVQRIPSFTSPCMTGVPCSGVYINWFGFVTIPVLALIGFFLILFFLFMSRKES
ncbi:disulfide oxidoreductase [Bacillus taeanensis]|uniref:Probable disulfide formation protein n=1 Tax=Bacillus taeanensis TaxID=273032 RepID=A0A366Y1F0_9BACI|nr:disulfide oxidoreductase [Bacillus taeanensis]RBW70243.1 disulfide bond formation protein B [Bacillus taeanensis]